MNYNNRNGFFDSVRNKILVALGGVMAFIMVIMLFASVITVDAGESCILRRFGDPVERVDSGLSMTNPFGRSTKCYTTRPVVYEVVNSQDGMEGSKADYVDVALDGVTIDGQPVSVTFTLRYRLDKDNLLNIHSSIGPDINTINERVVKFHSRTIVRQVINKHTASDLYLGGLDAVSQEAFDLLEPRFADSYVILEYFEIKRPNFTQEYTDAIEAKQLKKEEAEAAENEQEVARQKAETRKINAQADADAQVIEAEGNAEALRVEGEAYRDYPELMEVKTIAALIEADLIIVPNDSMPILDLNNKDSAPTTTNDPVETPVPTPEPAN